MPRHTVAARGAGPGPRRPPAQHWHIVRGRGTRRISDPSDDDGSADDDDRPMGPGDPMIEPRVDRQLASISVTETTPSMLYTCGPVERGQRNF